MNEMMRILLLIGNTLDSTASKQLKIITEAALSMTGRVTMLGLSRWSSDGGSYRTVQRFFGLLNIPWMTMNWLICRCFLQDKDDVILLAGDEVTVTKSGKKTHGLDRFFSSIQGQVVPGLCFLCISLISVNHRKSFPLQMHQLIKKELGGCSKYREVSTEKETAESHDETKKKRGRPKGRQNFNRRDVELSPYMAVLQEKIKEVQLLIADSCVPKYFLFDGELGNNFALQMVRQLGLHLICKLRHNSQLYLPWQGEYSGRGRKRIYGERLLPQQIPNEYLVHETCEAGVLTEYFQIEARHKKFPDALNVVFIRKTSVNSGKVAHVILFSSDLTLAWDKVVDYYRLRFQIEFNFRDAKQYWGLEDFMVVKEAKVRNSACFSMFMVNMAYALIVQNDGKVGKSMHDVKVWFLARKQVQETLKLCRENAERIFINELIDKISMKFMVNTS